MVRVPKSSSFASHPSIATLLGSMCVPRRQAARRGQPLRGEAYYQGSSSRPKTDSGFRPGTAAALS